MTASAIAARVGARLTDWWCAAVAALLLGSYHAGLLRVRYLLVGAVLVSAAAGWIAWRGRLSAPARMFGVLGLALPLLGAVSLTLGDPYFEWLPQIALLLLGASWLSLATTAAEVTTRPDSASRTTDRDWVLAVMMAALVTFGGEFAFSSAAPRIVDESWFLLQADLLAHGRLTGTYPVGLEPLYGVPLGRFEHGVFTSQYPLGWPALLAVPVRLGMERWLPPLLGFAAALGAGMLARRVAGPMAGVAAVVLTAGSTQFAAGSWTYFSQVVSGALLVFAALALEAALEPPARAGTRTWMAVLTGLLGGLLFSVRPLTAAAFGAVAAVRVVAGAPSPAARLQVLGGLTFGFVPPALAVFLANTALTGSWRTFGYEFVNGPLASLGFGDRGYHKWMPDGRLTDEIVHFVPLDGVGYVMAGVLAVLATFLPVGVLLPLLARRHGAAAPSAVRWWGAAIAVLIGVHGFWFYRSTRFFEDAIPLLAAAAAVLLAALPGWHEHGRRWSAQLAVIGLAVAAGTGWLDRPWSMDVARTVDAIRAESRMRPVVVVVEGRADRDAALQALLPLNGPRHAGHVQVVRDVGVSADSLRALFPDRTILRLACAPCDEQRRAMHPSPRLTRLPARPTADSTP